jgi:hypothetical protein
MLIIVIIHVRVGWLDTTYESRDLPMNIRKKEVFEESSGIL